MPSGQPTTPISRADTNQPATSQLGRNGGWDPTCFIALPGRNHLFLKLEPAAARFFDEINLFLTK
jgi:hypothetical protein